MIEFTVGLTLLAAVGFLFFRERDDSDQYDNNDDFNPYLYL